MQVRYLWIFMARTFSEPRSFSHYSACWVCITIYQYSQFQKQDLSMHSVRIVPIFQSSTSQMGLGISRLVERFLHECILCFLNKLKLYELQLLSPSHLSHSTSAVTVFATLPHLHWLPTLSSTPFLPFSFYFVLSCFFQHICVLLCSLVWLMICLLSYRALLT